MKTEIEIDEELDHRIQLLKKQRKNNPEFPCKYSYGFIKALEWVLEV